jgi:hypothetical protein
MGVRDRIAKAVMGIKAYHSSPHDFDRFDLSKIGTGEGAQVYGHGIYAAENPAVSGQGGQYWQQFTGRFQGAERSAADRLHKFGFDRDAATADAYKAFDAMKARYDALPQAIKDNPRAHGLPTRSFLEERQQEIDLLRGGAPVGPRTYELNIKADPAQMLDWDKPLREQSPYTKSALESLSIDNTFALHSGEKIHRGLAQDYEGAAKVREVLHDAGIPGIKYLDEGSRGIPQRIAATQQSMTNPALADKARAHLATLEAMPQTSNYVVFDPSIIDITKKYGIPGAIAAPVMGAIGDQSQYQEAQ